MKQQKKTKKQSPTYNYKLTSSETGLIRFAILILIQELKKEEQRQKNLAKKHIKNDIKEYVTIYNKLCSYGEA